MRFGGLLIAGSCLALGTLFALSASVDVYAHHAYEQNLQYVETLDTRLSQDVLRLRYGLLRHYDGIVEDLAALDPAETRLLEPPAFLDAGSSEAVRAGARRYVEAADRKAALVERFKSTNSALKASLRYFPIASHHLLETASPPVAREARALLDAVLEYEVSGTVRDREKARAALARLEQIGARERQGRETKLDNILLHAGHTLTRRAELDLLLTQIDAAPTRASLTALQRRYHEAYANAHHRAHRFRWLLFLIGTLTVAGTVHALRALGRAKAELEQANADLDRRVSERTADLDAAKGLLERDSEELRQLNLELERSNRELDDFAYIASHDLKEPLRDNHNYACFLIEDYGETIDEEGRKKLETLGRLAKRMDGLIETLLHFSRVGRTELACGQTPIQEIVEEVIESLHISLEERGVEVRIPKPLPEIHCDRVRVTEAFRNLVSNALKYNDKPEKWIEIGIREDPDADEPGKAAPTFYVRDNGIGIREKHLGSVFRIFKRLHGRDKFGGGTGAGLTIVKKIVERHGGEIRIESQYGEGTTFFFDLGGASVGKGSTRIMVVEDSPEDFEATARGFAKAGLKNPIIHCEDGDEALDYLHRRGKYEDPESSPRPTVILLDLNLPGTDGREVLDDIKNDAALRSIPVVVLTTSSDERDIEACYRAGANSYVQKPVNLEGFVRAIDRLKDYWLEITILPNAD